MLGGPRRSLPGSQGTWTFPRRHMPSEGPGRSCTEPPSSRPQSDCWVNINKNYNRNGNNFSRNPRFNGECNNCGKRGHRAVDCSAKEGKEKYDDIKNLFVGATLCGEDQEESNKEDLKEWLGDSGASLHITYKKKNMTDF